jgi:hypothetical protein
MYLYGLGNNYYDPPWDMILHGSNSINKCIYILPKKNNNQMGENRVNKNKSLSHSFLSSLKD